MVSLPWGEREDRGASRVAAGGGGASGALARDAFHVAALAEGCQGIFGETAGAPPVTHGGTNVGAESVLVDVLGVDEQLLVLPHGESGEVDDRGLGVQLLRRH